MKTEDEMWESEERLNTLLMHTPAVIYSYRIVDGEPVTTYVSESIKDVLGFETGYFIQEPKAFYESIHPGDAEKLSKQEQKLLTSDDTSKITVEYRIKDSQGDYRWLHDEQKITTKNNGTREIFGSCWDITERKETEKRLKKRNHELDEFASVLSHDLRNPLSVAKGRINVAREENDNKHLEAAMEAVNRSFELIDTMLELAKMGQDVTDPKLIRLGDLVEDCWRSVETEAAVIEIEIKSTVRADQSRLRQLFENLFRNSIEHGDKDVTVIVGMLSDRDGVYVEDDGPGVPKSKQKEIFRQGYSGNQDGTGFGLSIAKQIVEAHGWNIKYVSRPECGARFEITGIDIGSE